MYTHVKLHLHAQFLCSDECRRLTRTVGPVTKQDAVVEDVGRGLPSKQNLIRQYPVSRVASSTLLYRVQVPMLRSPSCVSDHWKPMLNAFDSSLREGIGVVYHTNIGYSVYVSCFEKSADIFGGITHLTYHALLLHVSTKICHPTLG